MKTLILLVLTTISLNAVSQNNKSICVTFSNPRTSMLGLQLNKMFVNTDLQAGFEYSSKETRYSLLGGFQLGEDEYWFNLGMSLTKKDKLNNYAFEAGLVSFVGRFVFTLNTDIQLMYARLGIGFNF